MPTIFFPSEEARIKGIGAMFRSNLGFSGHGKNKFGVSELMIQYLIDQQVEFVRHN